MKRFWQTCLAVVVSAASASAAHGQWDDPTEIGSYQSILARAGYGDQAVGRPTRGTLAGYGRNQDVPLPPGAAMAAQHNAATSESVMMAGTDGGATGNYLDAGVNDAGCGDPVYSPDTSVCNEVFDSAGDSRANWVVGLFAVNFRRDYEDNRRLGWNGAGTDLYTRDVENGNMVGGGLSFARRNCNGSGFEAVFWGLDEEDSLNLPGPTYTYLNGLANVPHPPSGATVADIFNAGDNARLFRDTDIFNFEFNLLRNIGQYTTRTGRCANYELLGGFRLFNFDESLRYVNYSSAAGYPATLEYSLEAENSLAGFQIGGRGEVCMTDRWRFAYSATAGVFNNYIETRQQIFDDTGYWAHDCVDTKNDAAFMGTMDLGLIYQITQCARARVGYRVLGASGVALAADQMPYDYTDSTALASANSNGDLLLYGWYYGGEFCF